jgi:hypothetical protein
MRGRCLAPPLAFVLAAAVAGCGESKSKIELAAAPSGPVPSAKAPITELGDRLTAAMANVQVGKCGPVNAFNKRSGFQLFCNPEGKKSYAGFKVVGTEVFGTGGVLEYTDAQIAKARNLTPTPGVKTIGKKHVGVFTAALLPSGRFELTGPISPILRGSVIGTKPVNAAGADVVAVTFLKSIRDKDCNAFYKYSISLSAISKKVACKQGFGTMYADLHDQLTSGKKVALFRQGGNAQFYFYGLRTGSQFRTLPVLKNRGGTAPFLSLGTVKATK